MKMCIQGGTLPFASASVPGAALRLALSPETFWPASVWMPNPSPSTLIRRPARSEGAGFPRAVSRGGSRDDPSWPSGGRSETHMYKRYRWVASKFSLSRCHLNGS